MKRFFEFLFSARLMAIIISIFAISIGVATFVENDFGTETARALIYNAHWFETLLFLGIINMAGTIIVGRLYRKEKLPVFVFHFSFILILSGAAITRFTANEGTMHIREGEFSNSMISDRNFLKAEIEYQDQHFQFKKPVYVSALTNNYLQFKPKIAGKKIKFECISIIPNATESIIPDPNGAPIIELVTGGDKGRNSILLKSGESIELSGTPISFSKKEKNDSIQFYIRNDSLFLASVKDFSLTDMISQSSESLLARKEYPAGKLKLYSFGDEMKFVIKEFHQKASVKMLNNNEQRNDLPYGLHFQLTVDDSTRNWYYSASKNEINPIQKTEFNNVTVSVSFGPELTHVPFYLGLNKFIIEHYPGSQSPSWFESRITLKDTAQRINEQHRIYMNNVLKHKQYRFYQTSYDADEKGTILTVNKDFWGTLVSYTGYFLLFTSMLISLFIKNSRFQKLSHSLRKTNVNKIPFLLILMFFPLIATANNNTQAPEIDREHAEAFGELIIQDPSGRMKPVNSLSSELLRKISRKNELYNQNSDQVFLGMMVFPDFWQNAPMIKPGHKDIQKILKTDNALVSFRSFFTDSAQQHKYILQQYVEAAYRKKPSTRNKFENEIIRVDERVNLCYLVYNGSFLRIFPSPTDTSTTWLTPMNVGNGLGAKDSALISSVIPLYFQSLRSDSSSRNYPAALLQALKEYQKKYGRGIIPEESKIKLEITYNKLFIFDRIAPWYGLTGLLLLVIQFVRIFHNRFKLNIVRTILTGIVWTLFILHISGLGLRWYISGHAPWSNGYESLLYIAFATVLAGLIFSKKSGFAIAISTLLAWLILHVAHLNWMDPEITPLVPVLKSYWLLIHVAIITASYGFLAISSLMAFTNLCLISLQNRSNLIRITGSVSELSSIIEMSLIVGLYLLTIGTFLGGIWANESWGRYWAWDPKETWALVSILVYAFVAHMRLIPGLKDVYKFNLFTLLAFSSILMTYFGVNYYLSGLHSYAKGDPAPVPAFVYYTMAVVSIIAFTARYKYLKFKPI